jgi:hypothetical protein
LWEEGNETEREGGIERERERERDRERERETERDLNLKCSTMLFWRSLSKELVESTKANPVRTFQC